MYRKALLATILAIAAASSYAAGPSAVAIGDRKTWPQKIDSPESFDLASRAELLAFGKALTDTEQLSDEELQRRLKVKSFDRASVEQIRARYWKTLTVNYIAASVGCINTSPFCAKVRNVPDFRELAKDFSISSDSRYYVWFQQAQEFHGTYVKELLRLAALFPRVSSEINTFSSREIDGSGLPDRTFLLSFDDGPTNADGTTDTLLQTLRESHVNGVFFTLGSRLQARLQQSGTHAMADAYRGMCVGSHGWEHRSHSTWHRWEESVIRSSGLVRASLPESFAPLFRPPYGQRRPDSEDFFTSRELWITLWNIDSQDWNDKVSADDVKQRVLALMLLWRHGIILFHDIHPKAQVAVPWLRDQLDATGVQWMDCKRLTISGLNGPTGGADRNRKAQTDQAAISFR